MPSLLPRKITQTGSVIRICDIGLPLVSRGSASPNRLTRLPVGSLALRPAALPMETYDPLLPERRSLELPGRIGQFPGRDFNPLDIQLLLRTDTAHVSRSVVTGGDI